jgi:hypothetical protein
MIIVKIIGGLGNQLFQYAFGRAVENKTGLKVYYDIEDFTASYKLRKLSLQHFKTNIAQADSKDIKKLTSIFNKVLFKIYKASKGKLFKQRFLKYYAENQLKLNYADLNTDLYLNGYWQSETFFEDISDKIKGEFELQNKPDAVNQRTIELITTSNSVSLHVRRGDYISNPLAAKIYQICPISYYQDAMTYITERVENPVFYVFSDDMDWVKNNLTGNFKLIFVDNNDGDNAHEDLRLMSKCQHNIIANSTFSWWGAWLNNNSSKIVIAPKKWFNDSVAAPVSLIPSEWIII